MGSVRRIPKMFLFTIFLLNSRDTSGSSGTKCGLADKKLLTIVWMF